MEHLVIQGEWSVLMELFSSHHNHFKSHSPIHTGGRVKKVKMAVYNCTCINLFVCL